MFGGLGDDTYVVNHTSDNISEDFSEGTDLIKSTATYTIPSDVENLTLLGSNSINGTGNNSANTITGNNGTNQLSGLNGSDILLGLAGDDTLYGGAGNDQITGGDGSDIFQIETGNGSDSITDYNSSEDNIQLLGGLQFTDLSFSSFGGHINISYGNDLLAIVQNTNEADLNFI